MAGGYALKEKIMLEFLRDVAVVAVGIIIGVPPIVILVNLIGDWWTKR